MSDNDSERTTSSLTIDELRELLAPEDLDRPMPMRMDAKPLTLRELKPLYRMSEEALVPWLNALLSDEFEQGMGRLHAIVKRYERDAGEEDEPTSTEHRYCCLGVFCETAINAGIELERVIQPSSLEAEDVTGITDKDAKVDAVVYGSTGESYLPAEVLDWAMLPADPRAELGGYRSLASLNDNLLGFSDVARVIFYLYGPDAPQFDDQNHDHRVLRNLEPLPEAE